jgi:hypothetical protein
MSKKRLGESAREVGGFVGCMHKKYSHCCPSFDIVHGRYLGGAVIIDAIFVSGLLDPL